MTERSQRRWKQNSQLFFVIVQICSSGKIGNWLFWWNLLFFNVDWLFRHGYFDLFVFVVFFLGVWMGGWLLWLGLVFFIVLVFYCGWIQVWVYLFRVKWNCGILLWMDALGGGKTDIATATDAPVSQNFFCHTQKNTLLSIILDLPFWFFFISNLWHGRWMGNTWRVWKGIICPTRLTL